MKVEPDENLGDRGAARKASIEGRLWIVEPGRIRQCEPEAE